MAHWSGALFPTNESLYIYGSGSSPVFGGAEPDSSTLNTLAKYDSAQDQWPSVFVPEGDLNHDARLWGSVANDLVNGTSFFTGGANNVCGMLEFDTSDPTHVSWMNTTQHGGISDNSPHGIGSMSKQSSPFLRLPFETRLLIYGIAIGGNYFELRHVPEHVVLIERLYVDVVDARGRKTVKQALNWQKQLASPTPRSHLPPSLL
ncbi:MAG: hypothetical protein Q9182_001245 [Xanthomendoza sp. 2 TL-2023]